MSTPINEPCDCAGVAEILNDLVTENLLCLEPGDRLWQLFCFRAVGDAAGLRHRVYTKRKPNGRLALVTFAAHNPPPRHGPQNGAPATQGSRTVRSGIARVADLGADDLARIIIAIKRQLDTATQACEELDLSDFPSLDAQLTWLQARA